MKEIQVNGIRYYTESNGNECKEDLQIYSEVKNRPIYIAKETNVK